MDQPKIERLLRILMMLTGNNSYTVEEIAERLSVSKRTVYRYIDSFRESGFVVTKSGDFVKIKKESRYYKDISHLLYFSEEESYLLKRAIENLDENDTLKQNLKKKLYSLYDTGVLSDFITSQHKSKNLEKLIDSIEKKLQVVLYILSSADPRTINKFKVEPFSFTANYSQFWAYNLEDEENKLYNLSSINKVKVLNDPWKNKSKHKTGNTDVFRISSFDNYHIKLVMGERSALILQEEFPLSRNFLHRSDDGNYIFDTYVCGYEGVGRFVLGLLDDIKIIEDEGLKNFVRDKLSYNV